MAEKPTETEVAGKMQNHLDELYLLEKRAADRTDALQERCADLSKFAKSFIEETRQLNAQTTEFAEKAAIAANTIDAGLKSAYTYYLRSIRMLMISVFITAALVVSWVVISFHYQNKVSEAKKILHSFLSQIDKTPVIMKENGKSYVLIKPGSEKSHTTDDGKIDTFAEIKYL